MQIDAHTQAQTCRLANRKVIAEQCPSFNWNSLNLLHLNSTQSTEISLILSAAEKYIWKHSKTPTAPQILYIMKCKQAGFYKLRAANHCVDFGKCHKFVVMIQYKNTAKWTESKSISQLMSQLEVMVQTEVSTWILLFGHPSPHQMINHQFTKYAELKITLTPE